MPTDNYLPTDNYDYLVRSTTTATFGRVLLSARDQHLVVDGPAQNGCPGEALTPAELFLGGVAAGGTAGPKRGPRGGPSPGPGFPRGGGGCGRPSWGGWSPANRTST